MQKVSINEIETETKEIIVFNDMMFLDEEEFDKYLDTCDAECRVSDEDFAPSWYDMREQGWFSEKEMRSWYGLPSQDEVDEMDDDEYERYEKESRAAEDKYEEDADWYDSKVEELINKYEIDYTYNESRHFYIFTGTYGNLKKFAAEYGNHTNMDNPGESITNSVYEATIDIESGDDDFIIGTLSK